MMKLHTHFKTAAGFGFAGVSRGRFASLCGRKLVWLTMTLLALGATRASASDPVGIYALVDKVVLEPNDTAPERIQIHGAFAFAKGYGVTYDTAKRGVLYYKLGAEKKEAALKEWADFKSLAGKKQVVGFGNRYGEKGTIRKAGDKPANPDTYPIGFGLTKSRDKDYPPVKELLALGEGKKKDAAK